MASATLRQAVASIRLNNYMSLAPCVGVGYDYIITFPNEVEYIWKKQWSRVSTLFVLVRYFGLCSVMIFGLLGSSFLPGPAKTCDILHFFGQWAIMILICSADLVMVLRVWVMYRLSKLVLGILFVFFAVEVSIYLFHNIVSIAERPEVHLVQVHDYSVCVLQSGGPVWAEVALVTLRFTFGSLCCLLVVARFVQQSLDAYKMSNGLQLNRYAKQLTRQEVSYFLGILMYTLVGMLTYVADVPWANWWAVPTAEMECVPTVMLTTRLILNLRALYADEFRGEDGNNIDTAFGPTPLSRYDPVGSTMVFANSGLSDEGIRMEERGRW